MRRALALAAALAAALMCVSSAAAASGDLRIGASQAFETPNPFKAIEAISVESYSTMFYDQLGGIRMKDQAADYHNALAKGVDVSPDGKTITFHLRTNIHWSDGKPFTSADALWTFNALLKNKTNQLVGGVPALKSVSAPDAKTFVMHLSTRDAEFLDKLAVPVLPAHIWSKIPINQVDKVNGPIPTVTTAPYQLTKWEKNGTTILTRNPRYDLFRNGGKAPAVKRILITYYANPDSIYRDVNQGNLDYGYSGPPTWARRAKTAKNLQLISAPRGGYWEIAFNSCPPKGSPICSGPGKGVNVKVVQDPAIRRAVAYAIGKERFVPVIYENQGVTAYGLISPRFKRYYINRKNTPLGYPYDPAKARQELKDDGWDCSHTPCTKGNLKAEFELLTLTSNKQFQEMAQRSQADLRKVGIVMDLQFLSDDALNNRIYASGKTKDLYAPNYDAFLWDWDVSGTTPTPIMEVLLSDNASSDSFYASQEFDKALQGARTSRTEAGVISSVRHAEAVALRDLPYFPLVHLNATEIRRKDTWHGWTPSPAPTGRPLFEASQQILALQPGPEPVAAGTGGVPAASTSTDQGWLTTPRSVLIGAVLIALAILGSRFIAAGQRRTEPLEWTEE